MKFWNTKPKRVYLDYAAATPLLPEAKAAMLPYLENNFANPGAIYTEGLMARQAVDDARVKTARAFGVRPEFVTFTSGGTEANNLAIRGALMALREDDKSLSELEVITLKTEHPATLKTVQALKKRGVEVRYAPVDEYGLVEISELEVLFSSKTKLVSLAYANSEIGTIQKLHAVKKAIRQAEEKFGIQILLHVDAAQIPLWLNCHFDAIKADLVSFDAAKCNGPKGVGALLRSRRATLVPITYGGAQEDGLRPGTENVPGIVGAAVAFGYAQKNWKERTAATAAVRDAAIEHIQTEIPEALINGPVGSQRLSNNINISIPGLDTEFATVVLDKHGFAVSTKSACAGAGGGESVVVKEISGDTARATSTLRISLGPDTTFSDLKRLTASLKKHLEKMATY